jgi:glycosyltransferase involved in cell wall biosynthesis
VSRRILYLQYTNPAAYPPLHHSSAILAGAGWEVLMLGIGAQGVERLVLPRRSGIRYKQIGGSSGGPLGPARYGAFATRAVLEAIAFGPDWCYVSDALAAPAGAAVRAATGCRVLYHEHDTPAPATTPFQKVIERARAGLVRDADVVIAPAQRRLDQVPAGGKHRLVVWNCPRLDEFRPPRPASDYARFRVVYQGSLSRDRITPQFVDALAQIPELELHLIGYETAGHRNYAAELQSNAGASGAGDRIHYHGVIAARADLLDLVGQADLGISTINQSARDPNLDTLAGASNKAFEYLARGLPVLVSTHPEWQRMYEEPGYGRACDPGNTSSIVAAVRSFIAMPDRGRAMGEAGRQRVLSEWNYETQFAPVLQLLSN